MDTSDQTAALRHAILSAAAGDLEEIELVVSPQGVRALSQASIGLVGILLKAVAYARADPVSAVAAEMHADLLLLDLAYSESTRLEVDGGAQGRHDHSG